MYPNSVSQSIPSPQPPLKPTPLESDPTPTSPLFPPFGREESDVTSQLLYHGGEQPSSPAAGIPLYVSDPPFAKGSVELQGEYSTSTPQSAPSSARSLHPASQQSGRMQPCLACGSTPRLGSMSIASGSMGSPRCGGEHHHQFVNSSIGGRGPPLAGINSAMTSSQQQQLTAFELRAPNSQTPPITSPNQHNEDVQSSRAFSHPELEEGAGSSYEMFGFHPRSPTSIPPPHPPNNPLSLLSDGGRGTGGSTVPQITTQASNDDDGLAATAIVSLTDSPRNTPPTPSSQHLSRALANKMTRRVSNVTCDTHDSSSTREPKNTLSVSGCAAIVMFMLMVGSLMGAVGAVVVLCSPVAEYPPRSSLISTVGQPTDASLGYLTQTIFFNHIVTNGSSSVHFMPREHPCPYFGLAFGFRVASLVAFAVSALGAAGSGLVIYCCKKRAVSKRAQRVFIITVGSLLVLGCTFGGWSVGLTIREGCGPAKAAEIHVVISLLGITIPAFFLLLALLGCLLGACPSRRSLSVQIVTFHQRRPKRGPQQVVVE